MSQLYEKLRLSLELPTGTRDELIAVEAFVVGVHLWALPAPGFLDRRSKKEYAKVVKREGEAVKKQLRSEMITRVSADPGKYKIVIPAIVAWVVIPFIVRIIVGKVIDWMVKRWLSGYSDEILEARLEIFKEQDGT